MIGYLFCTGERHIKRSSSKCSLTCISIVRSVTDLSNFCRQTGHCLCSAGGTHWLTWTTNCSIVVPSFENPTPHSGQIWESDKLELTKTKPAFSRSMSECMPGGPWTVTGSRSRPVLTDGTALLLGRHCLATSGCLLGTVVNGDEGLPIATVVDLCFGGLVPIRVPKIFLMESFKGMAIFPDCTSGGRGSINICPLTFSCAETEEPSGFCRNSSSLVVRASTECFRKPRKSSKIKMFCH